ncbi:Extra-large G-protein-like [Rhynchospora pubera]|uniref:Extra-large G-protein-like n=1 Tax=Rhynchospora pubera TaxID=906938 RepID=A0AAV8GT01_9POAL|nr:Extra-large G-protein-like [Rhynchospora pubera]
MEEGDVGAQIRVVRCPKCEKLLPELPNFSVYLCGGCGATLQAKKLNQATGSSPEKSNGGNVKYLEVVEEPDSDKKTSSPLHTSALAETEKPIRRLEPTPRKEVQRHASPSTANEPTMNPSCSKTDLKLRENGSELNQTKYRRVPKTVNTGSAQSNLKQELPDIGLYDQKPNASIEGLEQDRAVLLRMLEEIRDQVKRSCEIVGKQNPATPSTARVVEPSRPRSGYSAGVPSYYPHGYGWRNQNPEYFYPQFEPDPLVSYHHEGFYHQPACACLHCYREVPVPVQGAPPTLFNNHRAVPALPYHVYHQHGYGNARSSENSPNLRENRMRRIKHRRCRPCQPVAGASPFVICYNCYELLQVPRRSPIADKKKAQVKLRCGSCSHAMILTVDGNEIVVSSGHENENSNDDVSDYAHREKGFPVLKYSFSSKHDENASGSDRMLRGHSSTSSQEMESETEAVSRVPSLPLHEHLNNSYTEKGNMSARSEQEKAVLFAENFKQNSVKDVPVVPLPTEMDFSPDEYPHQGLSQDSDAGHEEERPVGTVGIHGVKVGGGDSFFTNLFKKGLKGGHGNGRSKVSINGFAISDRTVKKAEKQAGPISPGDYWYDYRAGFWGIMGHHCLGMIPPYIDEFNYPLPKNCAGGNTGVVINGRELHRKDLELLVSRGLPSTPGMSYRIEVSGKVWDEYTGEELYSLGKLAPTVEKMRKGFGMRIPRVAL